jgi:hypothetical protein
MASKGNKRRMQCGSKRKFDKTGAFKEATRPRPL